MTVRLVDEAGIPVDGLTPVADQYGMTLEDWTEFWGLPAHIWSNIRRHRADEEPG